MFREQMWLELVRGLYVVSMKERLKRLQVLKTRLRQRRQVGGISGVGKLNSILSNSISFDNYIIESNKGQQVVGGAIGMDTHILVVLLGELQQGVKKSNFVLTV